LEVWKLAISFVKYIYQTTEKFPSHENYGLTFQLRKAAVSIPSNIAEGQFRNSPREFKQFLSISLGSAAEYPYQKLKTKNQKQFLMEF